MQNNKTISQISQNDKYSYINKFIGNKNEHKTMALTKDTPDDPISQFISLNETIRKSYFR